MFQYFNVGDFLKWPQNANFKIGDKGTTFFAFMQEKWSDEIFFLHILK